MKPASLLLAAALIGSGVAAAAAQGGDKSARGYLAFDSRPGSGCMRHDAEMRLLANEHPSRAIEVVMWRYLGDTRSQGRSEWTLEPGAEAVELGCTRASGLPRRWEVERASFAPE